MISPIQFQKLIFCQKNKLSLPLVNYKSMLKIIIVDHDFNFQLKKLKFIN